MPEGLNTREFLAGYLAEAGELLDAASTRLVAIDEALRRDEPSPRAVRDLFRATHTLKGLSAMIGAQPIVDLAHAMEGILRVADQRSRKLTQPAVDGLVRGVRAIEQRVRSLGAGETPAPAPPALLDELSQLPLAVASVVPASKLELEPDLASKLTASEREQLLMALARGKRALTASFRPGPDKAASGLTITSVRERVGEIAEIVRVLPRAVAPSPSTPAGLTFTLVLLTDASDETIAEAASTSPDELHVIRAVNQDMPELEKEEDPASARGSHVRVDVARLDDALEHLSALVVTRFRLQRALTKLATTGADVRTLEALIGETGRELRDLRAAIMRARMVPVQDLLERAPLLVRGLAQAAHKPVRLVLTSGRAELDKSVGDRLFPAIVHLLRNAVDHGIETPEERAALGKPAEAVLRISCEEHGSNQLELSVADDGRGIDRSAVASRAGTPEPRTERELLELLTRPGLSTLATATEVSGRGMGMDIVRRIVVDELGGELQVRTTPGQGTAFVIRVPLSLTIVDAFSFVCGDETFATPVTAVSDLADLEGQELAAVSGAGSARLLRHRGALVPLVELSGLLGVGRNGDSRRKAIIVGAGSGEAVAFAVDRMLGRQEIVVRPVTDPLVRAPGVAGSTDLGDGRPTLVLDLATLADASHHRRGAA